MSIRRKIACVVTSSYSDDLIQPKPPIKTTKVLSEEEIKAKLHRDLFLIAWKRHQWLKAHGKSDDWKYQRRRLHMLRQWFNLLDADGSGEVGLDELADPLISTGLARNRQDVVRLIQSVDKNQSGELSFDDFLMMMDEQQASKISSASSDLSNPVIQLYNTIMSGGIGDVNLLSLSYLLSAYSRKMFLAAYLSPDPKLKKKGRMVLHSIECMRDDETTDVIVHQPIAPKVKTRTTAIRPPSVSRTREIRISRPANQAFRERLLLLDCDKISQR